MNISKDLMILNSKLDSGEITKDTYDLQLAVLINKKKQDTRRNTIFMVLGAVAFFFIMIVVIAVSSSSPGAGNNPGGEAAVTASAPEAPNVPTEYSAGCPVSYTADIADNIIGVTEITCSIKNNKPKQIAAVKFYFEPTDVYGEVIDGIFTVNELSSNDAISANGTAKLSWSILDDNVTGGNLYLYSVYFSDGTYWGNKDAGKSEAMKYGVKTTVKK